MTDYTPEARQKLEHHLATHDLPKGLGTKENACSIAAVNLALSGKMADDIPDCMSEVVGKATIVLQDAMPAEMRNSARYKSWLPTAVGTGRNREQERLAVLLDWMWDTAFPQLQPFADEKGFGEAWQKMCGEKTADAAAQAARDARVARDAYAARDARAAYAARAAAYAARAVAVAAVAARATTYAARAAADAAADAAHADFWEAVDPIGVLERMTNLEQSK